MTTTDSTTSRMMQDLREEKRQAITSGTLHYSRQGGNAAGAHTRYHVTAQDATGAYFIGYVQQVTGEGWTAEGAWSGRPTVARFCRSRAAAGTQLRKAAMEQVA